VNFFILLFEAKKGQGFNAKAKAPSGLLRALEKSLETHHFTICSREVPAVSDVMICTM